MRTLKTTFHTVPAALEPCPINPAWILLGNPVASSTVLSRSADGDMTNVLWEVTPGVFRWHYAFDEMIYILEGEVTLLDLGARAHLPMHLGPGDSAMFHAGTVVLWQVETRVRKIAAIRNVLPPHLLMLRDAWRWLKRLGGAQVAAGLGAR